MTRNERECSSLASNRHPTFSSLKTHKQTNNEDTNKKEGEGKRIRALEWSSSQTVTFEAPVPELVVLLLLETRGLQERVRRVLEGGDGVGSR